MSAARRYRVPHLALRMVREKTIAITAEKVSCGRDVAAIAHDMIGELPNEHLIAILIDGRGVVTGITTLAIGGMHGAGVTVPHVLRSVLAGHASAFILAHNHPSNDPEPSREDRALTELIARAAAVVGVPLLDHVIVTRSGGFRCIPTLPESD